MALVWMGGRARVLNNREVRDEARRMRRKAKRRLLYTTAWPRRVEVDCGLRRRGGYRRERALAAREAEHEQATVALLRWEREADERQGRAYGWTATACGLMFVAATWTGALLVEAFSKPLAAVVAACAFGAFMVQIEKLSRRPAGAAGFGRPTLPDTEE